MTIAVKTGWSRFLLWSCYLSMATSAVAEVLVDPFLEDFRVGEFSEPARITLRDGWPAGLLQPPVIDPAWERSAQQFFAGSGFALDDKLLTWRFLMPAVGGSDEADTWYRRHAERVAALVAGAGPPDLVISRPAAEPYLAREILAAIALDWANEGAYVRAGAAIKLLLRNADALDLTSEEKFIWNLRRLRLEELAAERPSAPGELWEHLLDLGPFDANSGWALWVAMRRARDLPLVPPGQADEDLAQMLASRRQSWLTAADLAAAGFAPEIVAGLGAVALPKADLPAHFSTYDTPPRSSRWQSYWVRGQRRLAPGQAAAYESLARTPGLYDGIRLDIWRRASENRLLAGDWEEGIADLQAGLALMNSGASAATKQSMREWSEKAIAFAAAHGQKERAQQIWAANRTALTGRQATAFTREAGYWARRLDLPDAPAPPDTASLKNSAAARVAAGDARPLRDRPAYDLATASDRLVERRWELWARWGRELCRISRDERAAWYAAALDSIGQVATAGARSAAACDLVGRLLRGTDFVEPLALWTLSYDLALLSDGESLRPRSPVPQLEEQLRRRGRPGDRLYRHALLAICLATGDDRGTIAVAVNLDAPGLTPAERLLFLYPVPPAGALRDAMVATTVEPALILATARNESLFDPGVRSRAGALGWLQIMPFHYTAAARLPGRDHWSHAATSLAKATELMQSGARRYAGDPYRLLAAYNAGPQAVQRWDRQLGERADRATFLAWIGYTETRRYVEKVLIDREIYDWIMRESVAAPAP